MKKFFVVFMVLVMGFNQIVMVSANSKNNSMFKVIAPENGCVISSGEKLEIMMLVDQSLKISQIVALCDSKGVGMINKEPYVISWDTKDVEHGEHTLNVFAYLLSGEKISADPIKLTFKDSNVSVSSTQKIIINEGSYVILQTTEKMVSGKVVEGSLVKYRVARDVLGSDGQILISYGAVAYGKVVTSKKRGAFGISGKLDISIDSVTAADGSTVPLRCTQSSAGKSNVAISVASTLFLSVFAIFIHGQDVTINEGTIYNAYVDHDTEVKPLPAQPGGIRSADIEIAAFVYPKVEDGKASIVKRNKTEVVWKAFPESDLKVARLFANNQMIGEQKENFTSFTWDTSVCDLRVYNLKLEIIFSNGKVKTEVIDVELK